MEPPFTTLSQLGQDLALCRNNSDGKLVVVKRVSYAVSAKEKQQLINEVNTLIKLDYIHIVKYLHYEINKKDVTVDLTIEYCSGGSLEDYLRNLKKQAKRVSEDMAWTIFYQLTQALDCIHQDSHGTLLHRNINPRCVLFKEEERKNIKLGGFGMAKKLDFEDNFSTTYIPNTCYLSPEQIQQGIFTKQTDIWALGCLMYEVCALQPPFQSNNQFEKATLIKEGCLKRTKNLTEFYSNELLRVIFWCLEKLPDDRPKLADLLGTPEISFRIRERRYNQKLAECIGKEERVRRREYELRKEEEALLGRRVIRQR